MENSRQPRRRTKAARVQQEIIERINSGIYLGKLPGVNQLAQEFAVNPLTISKVLRNLSELGLVYQRERIGTFVGRKRRIGFLIFKSDRDRQGNPDHLISYYKIIRGCARVMEPEHLTLHSLVAASNEVEAIEQLKREVDALVFSTAGSVSEEELAITAGVPRVRVLGDYRQRSGYPQITYDNDAIGPLAAEYLVRCGCRRFITFGPLPENLNESRYRSFALRVAEFGHRVTELPLDPYFLPFSEYMEQGRRQLAPALESRGADGDFRAERPRMHSIVPDHLSVGAQSGGIHDRRVRQQRFSPARALSPAGGDRYPHGGYRARRGACAAGDHQRPPSGR